MYNFNEIHSSKNELKYISDIIQSGKLQAYGYFDKKVSLYMKEFFQVEDTFLVNSCTAALEISALLLDIKAGDEIIMPSYTYVTTASAFVRCGARIVFVDVDQSNMCINLDEVKKAITSKTKAIVAVHYAAVSCDMDELLKIANEHSIFVIEDAAQGIYAKYKEKYLGSIGHIGCFSFHESKNITSGGEGGMLLINDKKLIEKARMIIEKGTDRSAFLEKKVSSYTWKTIGSSYGMGQLNAAFLYAQLEEGFEITVKRSELMNLYRSELESIYIKNNIVLFEVPQYNTSNGHMFYIKTNDEFERIELVKYLDGKKISAVSHYEPLHNSEAGEMYGEFSGIDLVTTKDAKRILRLPLHTKLSEEDVIYISDVIKEFYNGKI